MGNAVQISQLSNLAYPIIDPAIYPSNGNEGVGFRNAFSNGEQYMTGPACVNDITINNCGLTAVGTTGNTRDGGSIGPAPTPSPTTTTALRTTTTTTTSTEDHAACVVPQ